MGMTWPKPISNITNPLERLIAGAEAGLHEVAQDHASRGESRAKQTELYNDETGKLRGGTFGRAEGTDIYIGAIEPYTVHVHEGTRYMAARPFLVEAAEETGPEYAEDAGQFLMQMLGGRR